MFPWLRGLFFIGSRKQTPCSQHSARKRSCLSFAIWDGEPGPLCELRGRARPARSTRPTSSYIYVYAGAAEPLPGRPSLCAAAAAGAAAAAAFQLLHLAGAYHHWQISAGGLGEAWTHRHMKILHIYIAPFIGGLGPAAPAGPLPPAQRLRLPRRPLLWSRLLLLSRSQAALGASCCTSGTELVSLSVLNRGTSVEAQHNFCFSYSWSH